MRGLLVEQRVPAQGRVAVVVRHAVLEGPLGHAELGLQLEDLARDLLGQPVRLALDAPEGIDHLLQSNSLLST